MNLSQLIARAGVLAAALSITATSAPAQAPVATFRSNVDLVRVSAVVHDRKGRFVQGLLANDFQVLEGEQTRPIIDFRPDADGVSVALLFDASGSMVGQLTDAREAAVEVLSWLETGKDEAGVFTFDTALDELAAFTDELSTLPQA